VRNQRLKAPQDDSTGSNLADTGRVAARTRDEMCGELLGWSMSPVGRPW
jgi:hypothetical protein